MDFQRTMRAQIPVRVPPTKTGRRGRPNMLPALINTIRNSPAGSPVIVKTSENAPGLYKYRKMLIQEGYEAIVISPNTERMVKPNMIVTNMSHRYGLLAFGEMSDDTYTNISENVQIVHNVMMV